ncbi:Gfo/Idh/MocA family oxidoreductase [Rubripirellula sp.]|nr:Gfo/Idh/MocA family oxidoreductase [Rubripirellula sp.]MDB4749262.1 Gfo/Idh/MocA family oxidoreductase [Rubripirellula sp.]
MTSCLLPSVHGAQPANPRIRIGQIGTSHPHAAGKLAAIRGLDEIFELVGVAEPDETRRNAVLGKEAYRDVTWMSQNDLLNSDVAAIAVETQVSQLVPTAIRCLMAGKHIHLDKPAGMSMPACRAMHKQADQKGLTIQMGYMLRYNPAFVLLFDIVQKGWLGRITEVTAEMGKWANDSLRQDLSEFSGGGMFELACHVIDAMVTILGRPDQITAHNRNSYPDKDTFLDNQLAVFDYPHAIATVRCNHIDPFGFSRRHFHVVGELGTFEINPLEPPKVQIAFDRPRGRFKKGFQQVEMPSSSGRYDAEFEDLADVIRGKKKLAWNSQHDLTVQESVLVASGMTSSLEHSPSKQDRNAK